MPDILCLMYADDIANCAETVGRLQQQLNVIEQFCTLTGMEVNLNKTEIIVFRNGGPLRSSERWLFRGNSIKVTTLYKYLGLLFTPSLSWTSAQEKLALQAQKSIFAIYDYQRPFGYFNIKQLFKLFDAMVSPILCYGSQVWGYKYSVEIETVQINFCKRYLGVKSSTNNCIVLGECGRLPMCITYYTTCVKYWCKLTQMEDGRYPKHCYYMLKKLDDANRITWATHVKKLLFQYGFGFVWISHNIGDINSFITCFKQRLIDCHKQNWNQSVQESSRCHHYKYFKTLLNTERYLIVDLPFKYRKSLSRFRCSSHEFKIETGRHTNVPFEARICQYCYEESTITVIECEYHVFFQCKKFENIRENYLKSWYSGGDNLLDFYHLLQSSDEHNIYKLSVYIDKLLTYN